MESLTTDPVTWQFSYLNYYDSAITTPRNRITLSADGTTAYGVTSKGVVGLDVSTLGGYTRNWLVYLGDETITAEFQASESTTIITPNNDLYVTDRSKLVVSGCRCCAVGDVQRWAATRCAWLAGCLPLLYFITHRAFSTTAAACGGLLVSRCCLADTDSSGCQSPPTTHLSPLVDCSLPRAYVVCVQVLTSRTSPVQFPPNYFPFGFTVPGELSYIDGFMTSTMVYLPDPLPYWGSEWDAMSFGAKGIVTLASSDSDPAYNTVDWPTDVPIIAPLMADLEGIFLKDNWPLDGRVQDSVSRQAGRQAGRQAD